ncbi:M60 family metallopeptidase [Antarcticibacterium sp. 1MA-6-2]|uniref:M60 family metallopeptidase n=1 Tax=Antarcticibacterium sp. 1MA-6-2 TaxID=2908210 RepID=UPI0021071152|nr:M60 family metallopeptidase [Antarcticibacterium sp. 1MA-6-2]
MLTNQFQPGGEIEKSIDGDYSTIYHSPWNGETSFPVTLEYFFGTDEKTIDYAVLYPRRDGGTNGIILNFTVYFKTEGDVDYRVMNTYEYSESTAPRIISFPEGIEDPTAIKLVVTKGMGDFASLAEIEFYNEENLSEDLDIFRDKSATELKPEVTINDIENIENIFIKNMAEAMFNHTYSEFRTGTFQSYPNPNIIATRNKTGTYGIYDNVTGIYVKSYADMVVFAGDFDGEIFLRVVDHTKGFTGVDFPIRPGINKFPTNGEEGLAYLIFQDDQEKEVSLNFATGEVNGYFDIEKHTEADWQDLLDNTTYQFFDVLGKYSHLTFTTPAFQQYTDKPIELIELYDEIVELEQEFLGLYKYNRENTSRMYFRVNVHQDMYMFATSYRTEYSKSTLSSIANSAILRSSPWGPAHEVGHINQTRPGLKWLGLTEVTTNIYSLYVQKALGNESRIDIEELENYTNRYEKAFTEILAA